jgi:DNA-binding MarR family transcriptional regulator
MNNPAPAVSSQNFEPAGEFDLPELLTRAGIAPEAIAAAREIDALLQTWRRRLSRRELGLLAIKDLGLPLDLAQLDVLAAIDGFGAEFDSTSNGETMVATIAERLSIDPSRASRMAAEMVGAGYAERIASQADARRTLIRLTQAGRTILHAVRVYRTLLMADFLSDWTRADTEALINLMHRFSGWTDSIEARRSKFASDIATLRTGISELAEPKPQ